MTQKLLDKLQSHPEIRSRECADGIVAYNFSKKAFWDNIWDETTVNARGLFMRGNTIVGRGYNKFFNVGQRPGFTYDEVLSDFQYPVEVSEKKNGYLGIAFIDNGKLKVFSKSGDGGEYADEAYRIVKQSLKTEASVKRFCNFLSTNNVSATFEIISARDVHIVKEGEERAILLDFIKNSEDFITFSKRDAINEAQILGLDYAESHVVEDAASLKQSLDEAKSSKTSEGIVVRDAEGRMTKVKSDHYLYVKSARGGLMRLLSGKKPRKITPALQCLLDRGIEDVLSDYTIETLHGSKEVDLPRIAKDFNL